MRPPARTSSRQAYNAATPCREASATILSRWLSKNGSLETIGPSTPAFSAAKAAGSSVSELALLILSSIPNVRAAVSAPVSSISDLGVVAVLRQPARQARSLVCPVCRSCQLCVAGIRRSWRPDELGTSLTHSYHQAGIYVGRMKGEGRPTCRSRSPPSSSWRSTSRPRRRSVSPCRRRCSPGPTR
jgi:hypothetical protein